MFHFELNENRLPNVNVLTESNLQQHERQHSNKRKRSQTLRIRKKPKLYADEYQKDVQVQDDFREYSDDSPVTETGLEVRSVDSRSEGSLRDFIVKDDDEEVTSVSDHDESEHFDYPEETDDDDSCCIQRFVRRLQRRRLIKRALNVFIVCLNLVHLLKKLNNVATADSQTLFTLYNRLLEERYIPLKNQHNIKYPMQRSKEWFAERKKVPSTITGSRPSGWYFDIKSSDTYNDHLATCI